MEIKVGYTYFIAEDFFELVNDPFLKINKSTGMRPHFLLLEDLDGFLWMVPLSSRVSKFEKIIENKIKKNRPHHGIAIAKIKGLKRAILFQDMFPIKKGFILSEYKIEDAHFGIGNKSQLSEFISQGMKVNRIINNGYKLTPTSPDIEKILKIQSELRQDWDEEIEEDFAFDTNHKMKL